MPRTVLILGGSGKVARHLARLLSTRGDTVHSLIRNPAQSSSISELGAKPLVLSLEEASVTELASSFRSVKPDVIVWSAGAGGQGGPERTVAVDRDAAIRSMDAAAEAGVKRYVMVSAFDVRDREGKPLPDWYTAADKERSDKAWGTIGRYYKAKFEADRELVTGNERRGLEYTIVRPSALTLEEATGRVAVGKVGLLRSVTREDVARVVVGVIDEPGTAGLAFDLVGGHGESDALPIEEAVAKVAKERIDCFEGYY